MSYQGNFAEDSTIAFTFTTRTTTGVPTVLAGSPVVTVYKGSGTTGRTSAEADIVLTISFSSVVGLNHVAINLATNAFFAAANDYAVVITTGTVGGVSVVGETVATFSIDQRSKLASGNWNTVVPDAAGTASGLITTSQGVVTGAITSAFTEVKGATWSSATDTLEDIRNATTGSGAGLPTLTVTVKDTNTLGAAISGVVVGVWNTANTVELARGTTNASGIAAVVVPGNGTYKTRLFLSGYTFTVPQTSVVSGDTAAEYYGVPFSSGTSSAGTVRVHSWEYKADGVTAISGSLVYAYPSSSGAHQSTGGIGWKEQKMSATTNASGYWYLDLAPNTVYDFDLDATRERIYTRVLTTAANSQFENLL